MAEAGEEKADRRRHRQDHISRPEYPCCNHLPARFRSRRAYSGSRTLLADVRETVKWLRPVAKRPWRNVALQKKSTLRPQGC
jgi:hypothetical protein